MLTPLLSLLILAGCYETMLVHPSICQASARTDVPLDMQTGFGSADALAEGLGRLQLGAALTGLAPVPSTTRVDDVLSLTFTPAQAFEVELIGSTYAPNGTCPTGAALEVVGTLTVRSVGGLALAGEALVIATSHEPALAWIAHSHLIPTDPPTGAYAELAEDYPCSSGPRDDMVGVLKAWSPPGVSTYLVPETAIGGEGALAVTSGCSSGQNEHEGLLIGSTFLLP